MQHAGEAEGNDNMGHHSFNFLTVFFQSGSSFHVQSRQLFKPALNKKTTFPSRFPGINIIK